jgi:hypothetical protein
MITIVSFIPHAEARSAQVSLLLPHALDSRQVIRHPSESLKQANIHERLYRIESSENIFKEPKKKRRDCAKSPSAGLSS